MDRHRIFQFDEFVVDAQAWSLSRAGREIHLEPVVLKLLIYLLEHRDRLVTRHELLDTVWGETVISDSALTKAVARLRKALHDDPHAPRYIETVHSKGYRFVAAVRETQAQDHATPPARMTRWPSMRLALALAAVAAVFIVVFWPERRPATPPMPSGIQSLAVLPLHNLTGVPEQDYFADGLQDSLITHLAASDRLRVISRQSTARYRGSDKPLTEIAEELGVDALVEGSLLGVGVGEGVEVNLQLLDGDSDDHLWAQRYVAEDSRVFDLSADAANAIGTALGLKPAAAPMGPVDARATRAYWQGLAQMDALTPASLDAAIERLETATEIEPGFALAWGNLAAAYAMRAVGGYPPTDDSIERARAAALRAIDADSHALIGYSALGWVSLWGGDKEGGCRAFDEALRLNPSARWAIHGDADCLMLDGRLEESVHRLRELQLVSPFAFVDNFPLTFHLVVARDYEGAIEAIRELEARFPGAPARENLSLVHWARGEFEEAVAEERRKLEWRGDQALLAALDRGYAAGGPQAAMRAVGEALVERSERAFVNPFDIGEAFAHAGAVDEAIRWLDTAVTTHAFEAIHLAYRPDFDILRDDPRFEELLKRQWAAPFRAADTESG